MGTGQVTLNLEAVRDKIRVRCLKNGVDDRNITIVGVTKTFSPEAASEGVRAGLQDLGENRVQEAQYKIPLVIPRPRWHLIGHLQKNKVRRAVELFDVIQSVDSLELAELISRRAVETDKVLEVLLQVNTSYERQKSGFDPGEILETAYNLKSLPNLRITGLMAIGPLCDDVRLVEKSFSLTRIIFDKVRQSVGDGFDWLSMGMSGDFELALDYGANILRIGTAIFGARR